ncbi:MAG: hypothetical protein WA974_09835 [Thermodesulfobacteriota bacterium]
MIKMWKLTEALKLDREGAARFFAVDNKYEEGKRRLRHDLHEDIHFKLAVPLSGLLWDRLRFVL